jgi:hypothetical protein
MIKVSENLRETLNAKVFGCSATARLKIVDLPVPLGPVKTIGRIPTIFGKMAPEKQSGY